MRPSRLDDFDALMELAKLSGPGFTSLPDQKDILRGKLEHSKVAFGNKGNEQHFGKHLLMLVHAETGDVAGCSAVKSGTGVHDPFFNYRIITLAQASQAAGNKRFDMDALILTNEYVGYTEVGTLFIKPEHRHGGAGRLAAQSRYLLMASAPELFSDKILAELRGVVEPDGTSPFWECLGRHFFRMSFAEADRMSGITDNQFIMDLMPRYPIYVDLLPPEAREVIGRCHSEGVGAYKLLLWEGFEFDRTVDIFDGGPLVAAQRRHIRTINESFLARVEIGDVQTSGVGIVSNDRHEDFRTTNMPVERKSDDEIVISAKALDILRLKPGDRARVWLKDPK